MEDWRDKVKFEVNPARLEQPVLSFVKAYWDGKRGSRPMPSRADIDPCELKHYLCWIVLVDVLPGLSDYRFRLVGTRVAQYFLRDATGKKLSECFESYPPLMRIGTVFLYHAVARDCVPIRIHGNAGWLGQDFHEFDCLVLPLSEDGSRVNMLLEACSFDPVQQARTRPVSSF